jgi:hypothetical protein
MSQAITRKEKMKQLIGSEDDDYICIALPMKESATPCLEQGTKQSGGSAV